MAKITKKMLKQYLESHSKEKFIVEIVDLFERFDDVKEYYQTKLIPPDEDLALRKHKSIIRKEFFPSRGFPKARLPIARKAVLDYKRICGDPAKVADLMVYYVEMGVRFTHRYGYIDDSFYQNMAGMYEKALQFILQHRLQETFKSRCAQVAKETEEFGKGVYDSLSEMYVMYLGTAST